MELLEQFRQHREFPDRPRTGENAGLERHEEAGYEYVVIDESWWLGERDAGGNIVVNSKQGRASQSGQNDDNMANIAAYIAE